MTYNFNFNIEKNGSPYGTTDTAAIYIAQELERRITSDKPLLEYRIATDLRETSEVELSDTERTYLLSVLLSLPIDNYFKGRLTYPLVQDVIDGVPTYIMRWQFEAEAKSRSCPILDAPYDGLNALNFPNLYELIKYLVENLPESTPEEIDFKISATAAFSSATTIERQAETVLKVQPIIKYSDADADDFFINARKRKA